jgi:hypothetical protein
VPLESEVRRIDLQNEAAPHDLLVFDPQGLRQGLQILSVRIIVLVAHRGGDNAG